MTTEDDIKRDPKTRRPLRTSESGAADDAAPGGAESDRVAPDRRRRRRRGRTKTRRTTTSWSAPAQLGAERYVSPAYFAGCARSTVGRLHALEGDLNYEWIRLPLWKRSAAASRTTRDRHALAAVVGAARRILVLPATEDSDARRRGRERARARSSGRPRTRSRTRTVVVDRRRPPRHGLLRAHGPLLGLRHQPGLRT